MTAFTWLCVRAWVLLKAGCKWPRLRRNYNLGQSKMEQQTPIPPKSRMKPREGQKRAIFPSLIILSKIVACENIRFSSLFSARRNGCFRRLRRKEPLKGMKYTPLSCRQTIMHKTAQNLLIINPNAV